MSVKVRFQGEDAGVLQQVAGIEKAIIRLQNPITSVNQKLTTLNTVKTVSAVTEIQKLNVAVNKLDTNIRTVTDRMKNFAKVTAAFATGAFFTGTFLKAADATTNLENSLALVVGRTEDLDYVKDRLYEIGKLSGQSVDGAAESFKRFGMVLKEDYSIDELLTATETLQMAAKISGGSKEGIRAAMLQFSQGMASGVLRGEELNSVLEQAPRVAMLIAEELGVDFGEMRKLAEDGFFITERVFGALLSANGRIAEELELMQYTFGDGITVFGDALKSFFGNLDKSLGVSSTFAKALIDSSSFIIAAGKDLANIVWNIRQTISIGIALATILGSIAYDFVVNEFFGTLGDNFSWVIDAAKGAKDALVGLAMTAWDYLTSFYDFIIPDFNIFAAQDASVQEYLSELKMSIKNYFFDLFSAENISQALNSFQAYIKSRFDLIIDYIKGLGLEKIDFSAIFWGAVETVSGMVNSIVDWFGQLWPGIQAALMEVWNGVIGIFKSIANILVGNSIVPDDIILPIVEWFNSLWSMIKVPIEAFKSSVIAVFEKIGQYIPDLGLGEFIDSVEKQLLSIGITLEEFVFKIGSQLAIIFSMRYFNLNPLVAILLSVSTTAFIFRDEIYALITAFLEFAGLKFNDVIRSLSEFGSLVKGYIDLFRTLFTFNRISGKGLAESIHDSLETMFGDIGQGNVIGNGIAKFLDYILGTIKKTFQAIANEFQNASNYLSVFLTGAILAIFSTSFREKLIGNIVKFWPLLLIPLLDFKGAQEILGRAVFGLYEIFSDIFNKDFVQNIDYGIFSDVFDDIFIDAPQGGDASFTVQLSRILTNLSNAIGAGLAAVVANIRFPSILEKLQEEFGGVLTPTQIEEMARNHATEWVKKYSSTFANAFAIGVLLYFVKPLRSALVKGIMLAMSPSALKLSMRNSVFSFGGLFRTLGLGAVGYELAQFLAESVAGIDPNTFQGMTIGILGAIGSALLGAYSIASLHKTFYTMLISALKSVGMVNPKAIKAMGKRIAFLVTSGLILSFAALSTDFGQEVLRQLFGAIGQPEFFENNPMLATIGTSILIGFRKSIFKSLKGFGTLGAIVTLRLLNDMTDFKLYEDFIEASGIGKNIVDGIINSVLTAILLKNSNKWKSIPFAIGIGLTSSILGNGNFGSVGETISNAIGGAINGAVIGGAVFRHPGAMIASAIIGAITAVFPEQTKWVIQELEKLLTSIKDFFVNFDWSNSFDGILNAFRSIADSLSSMWQDLLLEISGFNPNKEVRTFSDYKEQRARLQSAINDQSATIKIKEQQRAETFDPERRTQLDAEIGIARKALDALLKQNIEFVTKNAAIVQEGISAQEKARFDFEKFKIDYRSIGGMNDWERTSLNSVAQGPADIIMQRQQEIAREEERRRTESLQSFNNIIAKLTEFDFFANSSIPGNMSFYGNRYSEAMNFPDLESQKKMLSDLAEKFPNDEFETLKDLTSQLNTQMAYAQQVWKTAPLEITDEMSDMQMRLAEQKVNIVSKLNDLASAIAAINARILQQNSTVTETISPPETRRASGGWVWGAGTATSDSIPAMLSNGEFVVNAKQAKKYATVLEQINSGGIKRSIGGWALDKATKGLEALKNTDTAQGIIGYAENVYIGDQVKPAGTEINPQFDWANSMAVGIAKNLPDNLAGTLLDYWGAYLPAGTIAGAVNSGPGGPGNPEGSGGIGGGVKGARGRDLKEYIKELTETLKQVSRDLQTFTAMDPAYFAQIGLDGAQGTRDVMSGNLSAFLKGEMTGKDALLGVMDQITGTIVDNFANSMINSIFNKNNLGPKLSGIFSSTAQAGAFAGGGDLGNLIVPGKEKKPDSVFDLNTIMGGTPVYVVNNGVGTFAGALPGSAKAGGAPGDKPQGLLESIFSPFFDIFKGLFGGITKLFSSLFGGGTGLLSGLFAGGFSTGGYIYGGGSSISDKLYAKVSPREFIVNANSTKKYRPMLEAMNNGRLDLTPRVGYQNQERRPTNKTNNNTFNIGITGDISRQTRREILRMLPEIAQGVDYVRKERG